MPGIHITAATRKLARALEDETEAIKQYGRDQAQVLRRRLATLRACDSLAALWPPKKLPERCHELSGDRAGTFSIDLKHPYRLLFDPVGLPEQASEPDERQRWAQITAIRIVGIEDTHG